MAQIKNIVIHHSVSPRDLPVEKSVKSFSRNHKERLDQPATKLDLPEDMKHCAYHWVIGGNGDKMQTRGIPEDLEVGYHASSKAINNESLGICLTGNFDEQMPTEAQVNQLVSLLRWIKAQPWAEGAKIIGHRDVPNVSKTCPGRNLHAILPKLADIIDRKVPDWAKQAWEAMETAGIFSQNTIPSQPITPEQLAVFLVRYNLHLEKEIKSLIDKKCKKS